MRELLLAGASALWLGILTSISPCPLATNIAAISFVGRRMASARRVLLAGLAYTLGRMVTYAAIGALLVLGALSIPGASNFLQNYMNKVLGPVLIIVGMVLLELISFNLPALASGLKLQGYVERSGILGAGVLGIVFALSFCPVSAALFFGSLVTLAVEQESTVLLPALYGLGTALPVVLFAGAVATGARNVAASAEKLKKFEWWARRITGAVFILAGLFYSLRYIFTIL